MSTQATTTSQTQLSALGASRWHVDPQSSQPGFTTRTMLGLMKVAGTLNVLGGSLQIRDAGEVSGMMRLDPGSISTGIGKRDTHLRSADFFNADEHPHFDFVLRDIAVDAQGQHTVVGDLEIRGKRVSLDAPLRVEILGPDRLRLATTAIADHQGAELGWSKPGMIRGQIPVHAELTLVRDRG